MGIGANDIAGAIAIGLGASLLMDLWNMFLKRVFNIPSLNYCPRIWRKSGIYCK